MHFLVITEFFFTRNKCNKLKRIEYEQCLLCLVLRNSSPHLFEINRHANRKTINPMFRTPPAQNQPSIWVKFWYYIIYNTCILTYNHTKCLWCDMKESQTPCQTNFLTILWFLFHSKIKGVFPSNPPTDLRLQYHFSSNLLQRIPWTLYLLSSIEERFGSHKGHLVRRRDTIWKPPSERSA